MDRRVIGVSSVQRREFALSRFIAIATMANITNAVHPVRQVRHARQGGPDLPMSLTFGWSSRQCVSRM